jgi:hypothetical protein
MIRLECSAINRNAAAWICMVSALALHVLDEAATGFLPFYNDAVRRLREAYSFFPVPTFTVSAWIAGLVLAITVALALTWSVIRGGTRIRIVTTVLAAIMVANASGHLLGSVYLGRVLPGSWSSPFLLAAALWMLRRGISGGWDSS